MKKIPVTEIQDGMVLAQPVTGSAENVLMGPGTPLKASMATRLQSWGISSVWIESDGSEPASVEDQAESRSSEEKTARVFQGRLVNSAMKTIYAAILAHKGVSHGQQ